MNSDALDRIFRLSSNLFEKEFLEYLSVFATYADEDKTLHALVRPANEADLPLPCPCGLKDLQAFPNTFIFRGFASWAPCMIEAELFASNSSFERFSELLPALELVEGFESIDLSELPSFEDALTIVRKLIKFAHLTGAMELVDLSHLDRNDFNSGSAFSAKLASLLVSKFMPQLTRLLFGERTSNALPFSFIAVSQRTNLIEVNQQFAIDQLLNKIPSTEAASEKVLEQLLDIYLLQAFLASSFISEIEPRVVTDDWFNIFLAPHAALEKMRRLDLKVRDLFTTDALTSEQEQLLKMLVNLRVDEVGNKKLFTDEDFVERWFMPTLAAFEALEKN